MLRRLRTRPISFSYEVTVSLEIGKTKDGQGEGSWALSWSRGRKGKTSTLAGCRIAGKKLEAGPFTVTIPATMYQQKDMSFSAKAYKLTVVRPEGSSEKYKGPLGNVSIDMAAFTNPSGDAATLSLPIGSTVTPKKTKKGRSSHTLTIHIRPTLLGEGINAEDAETSASDLQTIEDLDDDDDDPGHVSGEIVAPAIIDLPPAASQNHFRSQRSRGGLRSGSGPTLRGPTSGLPTVSPFAARPASSATTSPSPAGVSSPPPVVYSHPTADSGSGREEVVASPPQSREVVPPLPVPLSHDDGNDDDGLFEMLGGDSSFSGMEGEGDLPPEVAAAAASAEVHEIEELKEDNERLSQSVGEMMAVNSAQKKDLVVAAAALSNSEAQVASMTVELETKRSEISVLQESLSTSKSLQEATAATLASTEATKGSLEADLSVSKEELGVLKSSFESLTTEKESITATLASTTAGLTLAEANNSSLEADLFASQEEADGLKTSLESLTAEKESMATSLAAEEAARLAVEKKLTSTSAKLEEAAGEKKTLDAQREEERMAREKEEKEAAAISTAAVAAAATLKADLGSAKDEIVDLKTRLTALQSGSDEAETLRKELDDLRAEKVTDTGDLASSKAEVAALSSEVEALKVSEKESEDSMMSSTTTMTAEIASLTAALAAAKSVSASSSDKSSALKESISSLERERDVALGKISELAASLKSAGDTQTEIEDLTLSLAESREETEMLANNLCARQVEVENLSSALSEYKGKVDSLVAEVASKTAENESLRGALEGQRAGAADTASIAAAHDAALFELNSKVSSLETSLETASAANMTLSSQAEASESSLVALGASSASEKESLKAEISSLEIALASLSASNNTSSPEVDMEEVAAAQKKRAEELERLRVVAAEHASARADKEAEVAVLLAAAAGVGGSGCDEEKKALRLKISSLEDQVGRLSKSAADAVAVSSAVAGSPSNGRRHSSLEVELKGTAAQLQEVTAALSSTNSLLSDSRIATQEAERSLQMKEAENKDLQGQLIAALKASSVTTAQALTPRSPATPSRARSGSGLTGHGSISSGEASNSALRSELSELRSLVREYERDLATVLAQKNSSFFSTEEVPQKAPQTLTQEEAVLMVNPIKAKEIAASKRKAPSSKNPSSIGCQGCGADVPLEHVKTHACDHSLSPTLSSMNSPAPANEETSPSSSESPQTDVSNPESGPPTELKKPKRRSMISSLFGF